MDEGLEVVIVPATGDPAQDCATFFWGDYHPCGDAGPGFVECCPGGAQ